ncbi:MAG: Flp family type IVb pilin [Blastomonas sp.]|nr:Flp family type IVb pilin [Blastomonas sp.]MDM7956355.1 Flp family type IVb pilin [Blastomonas sp.]
MRHFLAQLAKSKRGATAIEYGLIVALVAIVCMTAINSMATRTTDMWDYVQTNVVPEEG